MYERPGWVTSQIGNRLIALAVALGMSPRGAHMLAVRGRTSGAWRTTPVNPLEFEGERYLVAPRGETHWVRNLRAAGAGELRRGRRRETVRVAEAGGAEKPPIIRAYLDRWAAETASHFGVGRNPTDAEIAAIAAERPDFRILR